PSSAVDVFSAFVFRPVLHAAGRIKDISIIITIFFIFIRLLLCKATKTIRNMVSFFCFSDNERGMAEKFIESDRFLFGFVAFVFFLYLCFLNESQKDLYL